MASPPTPLRMERGVITEIPLHVWCTYSIPSPSISRPIGVTSHTTEGVSKLIHPLFYSPFTLSTT